MYYFSALTRQCSVSLKMEKSAIEQVLYASCYIIKISVKIHVFVHFLEAMPRYTEQL